MLRPRVHLTHVAPTGLNPNRIVHDMIHDRVGQRTSVQPGTPIRLLVLRTENGGCSVIPPPYELEDDSQQPAGWRIQKPLIHQQDATTGARGQNTGWLRTAILAALEKSNIQLVQHRGGSATTGWPQTLYPWSPWNQQSGQCLKDAPINYCGPDSCYRSFSIVPDG